MTAIIGVASIANARLLSRSAVPSRYQQFDVELKGDNRHLHDMYIDRDYYIVQLHGRSDKTSYLEIAGIQIPIANREHVGWILVFIALTMAGALIRVPLLDCRSASELTSTGCGG